MGIAGHNHVDIVSMLLRGRAVLLWNSVNRGYAGANRTRVHREGFYSAKEVLTVVPAVAGVSNSMSHMALFFVLDSSFPTRRFADTRI